MSATELLAASLAVGPGAGLNMLLANARKPTWRIWAENSSFDLKGVLKARGYCWNLNVAPFPKAWFADVANDPREAELTFVQKEIYRRESNSRSKKLTLSICFQITFDSKHFKYFIWASHETKRHRRFEKALDRSPARHW